MEGAGVLVFFDHQLAKHLAKSVRLNLPNPFARELEVSCHFFERAFRLPTKRKVDFRLGIGCEVVWAEMLIDDWFAEFFPESYANIFGHVHVMAIGIEHPVMLPVIHHAIAKTILPTEMLGAKSFVGDHVATFPPLPVDGLNPHPASHISDPM